MMTTSVLICVILLGICMNIGNSYKILCVYPTVSRSHFFVAQTLFKGLAGKGHQITVLTTFPSKISMKNYREIRVPEAEPLSVEFITSDTGSFFHVYRNMQMVADKTIEAFENLLTVKEVQEIMSTESFDLVIFEGYLGNVMTGFGAHFNCPTISFQSFDHSYYINKITGNPLALSYVPSPEFNIANLDLFKNRVLNMLCFFTDYFFMEKVLYDTHKTAYEKHFASPQRPPYDDMLRNVSIHFVVTHFSQGDIRPLVPAIVQISGIHVPETPSPLPDDLQKWMDDSTNGVIYFSLGSNMKSSWLPENLFKNLLKEFRKLKMNVLWKFESDTDVLPRNVRVEKWVPQADILQHKNVKLFITHGGLGSVTEAKYYGVPLIVIPLLGDQMTNAEKVVTQGWGIQIPFAQLSAEILSTSINEVISNPNYNKQAKYVSTLFRDRPITAMETGIYWVEYVIRHHGAKHLQSNAVHLNFFQFHSLDVIGFLLVLVVILVLIIFKLLCYVFRIVKVNKIKTQ